VEVVELSIVGAIVNTTAGATVLCDAEPPRLEGMLDDRVFEVDAEPVGEATSVLSPETINRVIWSADAELEDDAAGAEDWDMVDED
jgi:hypothetical protein